MSWFDDLTTEVGTQINLMGDDPELDPNAGIGAGSMGVPQSTVDGFKAVDDATGNEVSTTYDWGKTQVTSAIQKGEDYLAAPFKAANNAATGIGDAIKGLGAIILVGGILVAMYMVSRRHKFASVADAHLNRAAKTATRAAKIAAVAA